MKKSLMSFAAIAALACGLAAASPAFASPSQGCDAKPAPMKPSKPAPGKGGGKKKCIEANVPLDDGYMLLKGKGKKKAPPVMT